MGRTGGKSSAVTDGADAGSLDQSISPEEYFEQRFRKMVRPGEFVLDAGCGNGKYSAWANSDRRDYKVVGLDNFESVRHNSFLDYRICGDVNELPFSEGSFDLVYGRWLVEHLENPGGALRELHRVLK